MGKVKQKIRLQTERNSTQTRQERNIEKEPIKKRQKLNQHKKSKKKKNIRSDNVAC